MVLIEAFELKIVVLTKILKEEIITLREQNHKSYTFNNSLNPSLPLACPKTQLETAHTKLSALLDKYDAKIKNTIKSDEDLSDIIESLSRNKPKNLEMKTILLTGIIKAFEVNGNQSLNVDDTSNKIIKSYLQRQTAIDCKFVYETIISKDISLSNSIFEVIWTKLFENITGEIFKLVVNTPTGSPDIDLDFESVNADVKAVMALLKERDVDEEKLKTSILNYKHNLKEDMKIVRKKYYLLVFEQMNGIMDGIEQIIDKKEDGGVEETPVPSGSRITNIQKNSMKNWTSTFY